MKIAPANRMVTAPWLCCLLLGACSSHHSTQLQASLTHSRCGIPTTYEQAVDDPYESVFSLMAPIYLFYAQNERWPRTGQELQGAARQIGASFDLLLYRQLDLRELQDGSLLVRFQLAPPGQAGGEFVLSKPDFQSDEEFPSQDVLMI
jgi:hypothetical protein